MLPRRRGMRAQAAGGLVVGAPAKEEERAGAGRGGAGRGGPPLPSRAVSSGQPAPDCSRCALARAPLVALRALCCACWVRMMGIGGPRCVLLLGPWPWVDRWVGGWGPVALGPPETWGGQRRACGIATSPRRQRAWAGPRLGTVSHVGCHMAPPPPRRCRALHSGAATAALQPTPLPRPPYLIRISFPSPRRIVCIPHPSPHPSRTVASSGRSQKHWEERKEEKETAQVHSGPLRSRTRHPVSALP